MAGASTRSRRTQTSNLNEASETVEDNIKDVKLRSSRASRALPLPIMSETINAPINNNIKTMEADSSTATLSTTEEISSNTSEAGSTGTSEKSTSESSVTSDETLNKTKDELIRTAHDLDSQLQELVKM